MTACSGLSCSVSTLDSGSFPSLPRRGTTLRFLFLKDNGDRFGVWRTGCRKRHNGRVLLRTRIHKDLGRSIEFVARCYEQDGPRLPISVVDDRDRSFKVCWGKSNINYRLLFRNNLGTRGQVASRHGPPSKIKIKACFLEKFWKWVASN